MWDPHCQTDILELEKIQKRAARFVTNNYTFEAGNTQKNMLELGWKPLEERRAHIKVNTFQKARMGLLDIPINDLRLNNNSTRGGNLTYVIPASRVDGHLYSFYPNTMRLWNSLPDAIKNNTSVDTFKRASEDIVLRDLY